MHNYNDNIISYIRYTLYFVESISYCHTKDMKYETLTKMMFLSNSRRNAEMTELNNSFPLTVEYTLTKQLSNTKSCRAKKSLMKALKMSLIHVLAFVLSWTPYTVMATW